MYDLVGWETAARPWEEIWIEEPQGQGRLHPDPAAQGATSTGDQGRRDRDTLAPAFQRPMLAQGATSFPQGP